ncbi:hypothetical protein OROMI_015065 [Orobanche minor]
MGGRKGKGKGKRTSFSPLNFSKSSWPDSGIMATPPLIDVASNSVNVIGEFSKCGEEDSLLGFVSDDTMPVQSVHPLTKSTAAHKVLDNLRVSKKIEKQPAPDRKHPLQHHVNLPDRKILDDSSAKMSNLKQPIKVMGNNRPERKYNKAEMDPSYVELVKNNRGPDSEHKHWSRLLSNAFA